MVEALPVSRTVPPLVGRMPPQCQRDLDSLRSFVHSTIAEESPAEPVSANDFREVLLTGATGFVGRFLLRELLRQNDSLVVHCLVRADGVEHGFARIRAALEHAEIWDDAFGPRIRVVAGDICEARFGLGDGEFDDLCRRIDAVYHLAADLSLVSSYASIRTVNASSLRNVLALCLRTRFKHVFYASTMAVFPEYFCNFSNEFSRGRIEHHMQPDLATMKRLLPPGFIGYPWSKLVSEQVLLFANAAGLPTGDLSPAADRDVQHGIHARERRRALDLPRGDTGRNGSRRLLDTELCRARGYAHGDLRRHLGESRAAVHDLPLLRSATSA